MNNLARLAAPLAVAALLASLASPAVPCGFHGGLGNTFTPMHPKSIGVALAVRDAIVAGAIEPAVDPALMGSAGYWRAAGHLNALRGVLSAARVEGSAPVSVLLIDSGLWARLTPAADGFAMDVHTEGSKPGDVTIVTSEPVLAAILEKHLPIADALDRGLIVIDGEAAAAGTMRRLVATALAASAVPAGVPQAVRLFGPAR